MGTRILITGVTGFLGHRFAVDLAGRGWEVHGTASTRDKAGSAPSVVKETYVFAFGENPYSLPLDRFDVLIQCAWDLRVGCGEASVDATLSLGAAAVDAGVRHQVFISTPNAFDGTLTEYGRCKLLAERPLLAAGHTILRPGLVVGTGGLFRRMMRVITRSPVIPLVGSIHRLVPVVGIADLSAALAAVISGEAGREWNLYLPEPVPIGRLVQLMASRLEKRRFIVSVPAPVIVGTLRAMQLLRLPLPVSIDSVRALAAGDPPLGPSDLLRLVPDPASPQEMIDAAFANPA